MLSARPRTAKSPHGGGNVIVTTSGWTTRPAQVREQWTRWWREAYEVIEIQPSGLHG